MAIWLTHWGRVTLIGPLGTNFSEILIELYTFPFKKIHLKMSSGKWRPFCLVLNALNPLWRNISGLVCRVSHCTILCKCNMCVRCFRSSQIDQHADWTNVLQTIFVREWERIWESEKEREEERQRAREECERIWHHASINLNEKYSIDQSIVYISCEY